MVSMQLGSMPPLPGHGRQTTYHLLHGTRCSSTVVGQLTEAAMLDERPKDKPGPSTDPFGTSQPVSTRQTYPGLSYLPWLDSGFPQRYVYSDTQNFPPRHNFKSCIVPHPSTPATWL